MRNSAAWAAVEDHPHELTVFARELSELCRKHHLGLGDAVVYEMQPEDYGFDYRIDDEGYLVLG